MSGKSIPELAAQMATEDVLKMRQSALAAAGVTLPKIVKEMAAIAFSNIKDYVTVAPGGEVQAIPLNEIKPKKTKAIKRIKEKTVITESKDGDRLFKTSELSYELYDKPNALEWLMQQGGWAATAKQEIEHSGVIIMKPDTLRKPKNAGKTDG